jgi:YhcH/YjgK/YiaL family protein
MIIDSIKNSPLYPYGELWEKAFDFLRAATPELEAGRYVLDGDTLFASVDNYETKARNGAKPETHRQYIDIQVMLSGREIFEIFPADALETCEPYTADRDLEFYSLPEQPAPIRFTLVPGQFAVFFPEDAHMPGLRTGTAAEPVQKIVIKVLADRLLRG